MAELNMDAAISTDLKNAVDTFSVDNEMPDAEGEQTKETVWDYPDSNKYLGYYKKIPELKKAVDGLAMWTAGQGWESGIRETAILENMRGWGEDSFEAIINNLIIQKKIFGDAFAEIIRNDKGEILNIKPLYTGDMRVVVDERGMILRYEKRRRNIKKGFDKLDQNNVLHLVNDRVANEIHGISVIEAVQWVIDARNEAMRDLRQMIHRSKALGVLEVDTDDTNKRDNLISDFEDVINKGEVLVLPKGTAELKDAQLTNIKIQEIIGWIKYLENFFYQAVGIPKVILGGSEEFTEASSKIGYLTFEQVYTKEQRELEADLWNQIALRVKFNKPVSLKNELFNSEQKNTGQTSIQPNEVEASLTRSE